MLNRFELASVVTLAGVLAAGCSQSPGRRLCDAITNADVTAAQQALSDRAFDISKPEGVPCRAVESVFARAKPDDANLTQIGLEMVKAGLPGNASWSSDRQVWAVEAAARNGNTDLVRALMSVGLDASGDEAESALKAAAAAGKFDVVKFLVEAGVPPEGDGSTQAPVMLASSNGHDEVAKYLADTIEGRAAAKAAAAAAAAKESAPLK